VDAKTNEVTEYVRTHAKTRLKLSCYKVCPATKGNVGFSIQTDRDWEAVKDDFSRVVDALRDIPRVLIEEVIRRYRDRSAPLPAFDFMFPFFLEEFVKHLTQWNLGANEIGSDPVHEPHVELREPHVRIYTGHLHFEEIEDGCTCWITEISERLLRRTLQLPQVIIIGETYLVIIFFCLIQLKLKHLIVTFFSCRPSMRISTS
jgi:hypothetical protein